MPEGWAGPPARRRPAGRLAVGALVLSLWLQGCGKEDECPGAIDAMCKEVMAEGSHDFKGSELCAAKSTTCRHTVAVMFKQCNSNTGQKEATVKACYKCPQEDVTWSKNGMNLDHVHFWNLATCLKEKLDIAAHEVGQGTASSPTAHTTDMWHDSNLDKPGAKSKFLELDGLSFHQNFEATAIANNATNTSNISAVASHDMKTARLEADWIGNVHRIDQEPRRVAS